MIYDHCFNGIPVRSGDILCTQDGDAAAGLFGQIWRVLGKLLPGEIDHCLMYLGPGGRCIESGARGVILFEMPGETWSSALLAKERLLLDRLVGAVCPLAGRGLSGDEENRIREEVVSFCLEQAARRKPYNLNYFDPLRDGAFYCSQLMYRAYLASSIDLDADRSTSLLGRIVFPEEIWNACPHRRVEAG
jgi:hypothetical protein